MSSDLSAAITAVATAALAAFAIFTAAFAYLAYRKQSQEVGLLLEQNEREAGERRMAQASRVFAAAPRTPGETVAPYAVNASDFPIYQTRALVLQVTQRVRAR